MERSLPMRGRKRPKSPHPAIIPESSRFGLVALAVTLLFLWAALTQQTILRLHHSTHTGLRSGGLKLWARLRFAGVRTSPRRVRRVMRENGLLAPHRVGRTETRPHDGTIITDKVNEMWGTDMTQTITIREGRANVFVAVEHANSEVVGIHASRSANRFEALEPVRQGVHRC